MILAVGLRMAMAAGLVMAAGAGEAQLSRQDMERALALTRWPHTDGERTRFHARYMISINGPKVAYVSVEKIEIITEFRRLELIAEDHMRLNDLFGRAGLHDVEDAMRPWRGRITFAAHLRFDITKYIPGVPEVELVLESPRLPPLAMERSAVYSGFGADAWMVGARIDAAFDAQRVRASTSTIVVRWKGQELARIRPDLSSMQ